MEVDRLLDRLSFIENKSAWFAYLQGTRGGGPANFGKPIGEGDYRLILEGMEAVGREEERREVPSHGEIQSMLLDLGRLEGYLVDKEVPLDGERVDVTWRRKGRRRPDVVFEVQRGGNFYGALVKLKEAWDVWGCLVVLVTTEEYLERARRWLGRAFHDMEEDARIVLWYRIEEWYEAAKKRAEVKEEVRIDP